MLRNKVCIKETKLSRTVTKRCLWQKIHKLSYGHSAMAEFLLLLLQKKTHSKSLINRNEADQIQKENVHSQYCILNVQTSFRSLMPRAISTLLSRRGSIMMHCLLAREMGTKQYWVSIIIVHTHDVVHVP